MELLTGIFMSIVVAVIGIGAWYIQRAIEKAGKIQAQNDACREKSQLLLIKSSQASIELGRAAAIALRDGKTNGETKTALEKAEKIQTEQDDFLREVAARKIY